MASSPSRVFIARLIGLDVFDPHGDRLGRVRDVVFFVGLRKKNPFALGIVVEILGRRLIFVPMTRITSIDQTKIVYTGLINFRRFKQRGEETLAVAELFGRRVIINSSREEATITDIGVDQQKNGDWVVQQLFVHKAGTRFLRRGEALLVDWAEVSPIHHREPQAARRFVATHEGMRAADFAEALHEMTKKRQLEVAEELQDERLADVLQELPTLDQVNILSGLNDERAADILEEMDPDDAADLLQELPLAQAEELLQLMEPDDAKGVRRLLEYEENTVGSLMTPVPIILSPEVTVAEALAHIRQKEISPALASAVFVCRPPLETPTGRFVGMVHFQKLLRFPPPEQLGNLVDTTVEPTNDLAPSSEVARNMMTYNMTIWPVINEYNRLVGAVTVDDILDEVLPEEWRDKNDDSMVRLGGHFG